MGFLKVAVLYVARLTTCLRVSRTFWMTAIRAGHDRVHVLERIDTPAKVCSKE